MRHCGIQLRWRGQDRAATENAVSNSSRGRACREAAAETPAALQALAPLQQPDGRVYFAGDYMTNFSSWMHGAFESGRATAIALHARHEEIVPGAPRNRQRPLTI